MSHSQHRIHCQDILSTTQLNECYDAAETAGKSYNNKYRRDESLQFLTVCIYDQNEYIYTLTMRSTQSRKFCENIRVKFEPTGHSDYRLETQGSCES